MDDDNLNPSYAMPELPRLVRDMTAIGLVAVDKRMNVLIWNRFMEINSQQDAEMVVGRNLFECFPDLPKAWLEKKLKTIMILKNTAFSSWQQRPYVFPFTYTGTVTNDVEWMYQDCSFWALRDETGAVQGACISIQDVSETAMAQKMLEAAVEQNLSLEETSQRDALTGLFNRRYFDEHIRLEMHRAQHYQWHFCLAMLDIDFFKKVNDTYGHDAGDEVLRSVAQTLLKQIRNSDILCRFGGEEFVLLLPKMDIKDGNNICERIVTEIRNTPIEIHDQQTIHITMSIGISRYRAGINPNDLLKEADQALYASKQNGRNQFTVFNG